MKWEKGRIGPLAKNAIGYSYSVNANPARRPTAGETWSEGCFTATWTKKVDGGTVDGGCLGEAFGREIRAMAACEAHALDVWWEAAP